MMKGLWKYLSPFAPDQAGACAVLYDMNCLVIICDAGGCAGNISGFDEPRWVLEKGTVFSAGLRDMDAILGRDDKLVEKIGDAVQYVKTDFAAIIGTPVPSVIGTDYLALNRMAEKRLHIPVITVDTTGMAYYDQGAAKTYLDLFKKFPPTDSTIRKNKIGVLGATPLDIDDADLRQLLTDLRNAGKEPVVYGGTQGITAIRAAATVEKNVVLSPSGLRAARYLRDRFNIPYMPMFPYIVENFGKDLSTLRHDKILIIHQQVKANQLRKQLQAMGAKDVTVASWFIMDKEWQSSQDVTFRDEETFVDYIYSHGFTTIFADSQFKLALKNFIGNYFDLPHFAVSGRDH